MSYGKLVVFAIYSATVYIPVRGFHSFFISIHPSVIIFEKLRCRFTCVRDRTFIFIRSRAGPCVTVEDCVTRAFEFDTLEAVFVRNAENVSFAIGNIRIGDSFVPVTSDSPCKCRVDVVYGALANIAGVFVANSVGRA